MSVIIHRPRRVARDVLTEPTNRQYLDAADLARVDEILNNLDEEWTRKQARFMFRCLEEIDEAQ